MADTVDDGPVGAARWFPSSPPIPVFLSQWRLDVVTLLAVIGESAMAEHSHAITASVLCLLPRILPAPQALLKPSRPLRMPETPAKMAGVYSGVVLDTVGFFANIIHPLEERPAYSFKAIEIRHKTLVPEDEGDDGVVVASATDPERGGGDAAQQPHMGLLRRGTIQEKVTDFVSSPSLTPGKRPAVPAQLYSPIHVLSVFSCLLAIVLIVMAVIWHDAPAVMAVSLVSLASSVVGYASWWQPILLTMTRSSKIPPGDIIIRTREGAFVYVKCKDDIARELYTGTEECRYAVQDRTCRILMALGTILLMVSVVLLGNCSWDMQLFIGVSYIVLNGLYWAMGMLPRRYFWDLSRYEWHDITPADARDAELTDASFTRTLWYAIRETRRTAWVERSGAAPGTEQWREWLVEAEQAALTNVRDWPAVSRKDAIMGFDLPDRGTARVVPGRADRAEQHAPLTEVQGRRPSVVPPAGAL